MQELLDVPSSRRMLQMATLLLICIAVLPLQGDNSKADTNTLVGAWRLVSLEEPGANGRIHSVDCTGQFVFTNNGKASVQVMYRGTQTGSSYAQSGYEASYGSYRVDSASTFTFHVDGALVRTLVGKDLARAYKISRNRLTVKSTDPHENWRVVWERY